MQCPRCHSHAYKAKSRTRVRRGDKVMWAGIEIYRCSGCRIITGPFEFVTIALDMENDERIASSWQEEFSEPIPPALPGVRMRKFMRTEEGKKRMAKAFGKVMAQLIKENST